MLLCNFYSATNSTAYGVVIISVVLLLQVTATELQFSVAMLTKLLQ